MKVKSATFYQAVKLGDGRQHNTVYESSEKSLDVKYKGVEMYFKNGLMMITGKKNPEWIAKGKEDAIIFVGITNIRGFEVDELQLKGTPFENCVTRKEYPTRREIMDILRENEVKFAGNITGENLIKLYEKHLAGEK